MSTRFSPSSHTRIWEHLNDLDDDIQSLLNPVDPPDPEPSDLPRCRGVITTNKAMSSGDSTINGWTEQYNVGSGWNASTGIFTVPAGQAGLYTVGLTVSFGSDSTRRLIFIEGDAGALLARVEGPASGYSQMCVATEVQLTAGQTLRPRCYCTSAASIRGDQSPASFFVRRVL
ncbi:MAG: hypothetical protein QM582_09575 [Micropruina sp.]|uniref:hypothetical protein n=1 Tax=Micropruina sp. TaxID=2737536 RepID=UPI0039E44A2E